MKTFLPILLPVATATVASASQARDALPNPHDQDLNMLRGADTKSGQSNSSNKRKLLLPDTVQDSEVGHEQSNSNNNKKRRLLPDTSAEAEASQKDDYDNEEVEDEKMPSAAFNGKSGKVAKSKSSKAQAPLPTCLPVQGCSLPNPLVIPTSSTGDGRVGEIALCLYYLFNLLIDILVFINL